MEDNAFEIRAATIEFADAWARMRHALWPDEALLDLRRDVDDFFRGDLRHVKAAFLAFDRDGAAVGFAEMNIRAYAEGCVTDRVAFLEGWFVEPAFQKRGAGRALIRKCEDWARAQGCTEFASDALYDNAHGRTAHLGVGFEEVEAIRCFRKSL